jgi:hypothetical protein
MKKLIAFSAVAICAGLMLSAAPASAQQSRMKSCNDEWNKMKEDKTVGDKKYADFRKECLARTDAPADTSTTTATKTSTTKSGGAVFPGSVSSKYSSESAGKARMHTCLDQYNANKTTSRNGGLNWIQKGGGYYSECNKHLKG